MTQLVSGTREWAVANINNTKGCANNCAYCYARAQALRFKRIARLEDWTTMTVRDYRPTRRWDGPVMFPTTHDVFPSNLDACVATLTSLLEHGNRVLIVSKPRPAVVASLLDALEPWREQVLLRFTIGTCLAERSRVWEPGAPTPRERFEALALAHGRGWGTSVSMEPMLNPGGVIEEFAALAPLVTDGIWLGKMNRIRERVSGVPDGYVHDLAVSQCDDAIRRIYEALKGNQKARWKESIKRVVGIPLEVAAGKDR